MIISYILGGIGNQMFQYAAGRALALQIDQPFAVDLASFSNYSLHHGFELNRVFNLNVAVAEQSDVQAMLGWRAHPLAIKVLRRAVFSTLCGSKLVIEPHFNFWPGLLEKTDECYLFGYWQSERYFKAIESTLRKDFTFRTPLTGRNAELAIEIARGQTVSLHVRRGDYVSDAKTGKVMDVCSLDYYHAAINYIAARVSQPVFYIFSDDIAWVKQNLQLNSPAVYIEHNRQAESYRDMQLMSLCQHQIIANSSFSWWGAWLNSNAEKIVIAPKHWFVNGNSTEDLIPRAWVRL
ncbi:MAG: alpha-1,2-fucosyltransferase [Gallionellaceae bacterium]|jgi:hypothetical protein